MQIQTERKAARPCKVPTAQVLKWPGNFDFFSIKVSSDGQSWPAVELTVLQAHAVRQALYLHEQEQAKRVTFNVGGVE